MRRIVLSRNTGASTLLLKGAAEYDRKFYIVAHTLEHARQLKKLSGNDNAIPVTPDILVRNNMDTLPAIYDHKVLYDYTEKFDKYIEILNRVHESERRRYAMDNSKLHQRYNQISKKIIKLGFIDRIFFLSSRIKTLWSEKSDEPNTDGPKTDNI